MFLQVNPGHGDFGQHASIHFGRKDWAIRTSEQSPLQAVQTSKTLTRMTSPKPVLVRHNILFGPPELNMLLVVLNYCL